MSRRVPPETIAKVLVAVAAGVSMQQAARTHRVAPSTVKRYVDQFKVPHHSQTVPSSVQWRSAMALVDAGMSQTEAARRCHVSQGHLSRHLARRASLTSPV